MGAALFERAKPKGAVLEVSSARSVFDSISPTLTSALPIGRRTAMCDAAGWEAWSYDSRGHVITERL